MEMMTGKAPALLHSKPARGAGRHLGKGVITLIKKIQEVLFSGRKPVRDQPREFNAELLNAHREDVFVMMHQQMGGLR
jgi:hypothetical protein